MVTVLGTLHRTYVHVPMIRHFRRLHIIIMIFLKFFFSFLFLSTHFLLEPLKKLSSFFEMRSHHRYCTIPILSCPEEIEVRSTFFLVFFDFGLPIPFLFKEGGGSSFYLSSIYCKQNNISVYHTSHTTKSSTLLIGEGQGEKKTKKEKEKKRNWPKHKGQAWPNLSPTSAKEQYSKRRSWAVCVRLRFFILIVSMTPIICTVQYINVVTYLLRRAAKER